MRTLLLLACLALPPAWGHEGHDHGPPEPAAIDDAPRAAAESELFELVAVLEAGPRLLLYLDRHDSNEPVPGARVEVESGAFKAVAKELGGGVYAFPGEAFTQPGTHSLTLSVAAGEEIDLLAASLTVPARPAAATVERDWRTWAAGGGALVLGVGLGWIVLRRRSAHGRERMRQTLVLAVCAAGLLLRPVPLPAHGGEDHGPAAAAPAAQGGASKRLSDGSVFLPKPVQRQIGLRTLPVRFADLAQSREFNGRVIPDPAASGRVQAGQAGRIEVVGNALPSLGQRVARGQLLARLRASATSLERGGQQALLAELAAQTALAERKLARYAELEGAIPAKEVEATRIELDALRRRRAAIGAGLDAGEALVAPVAGVISAVHVVPGQVVEAREILFEIVDPERLAVEALAYDPAQALGLRDARLVHAGGALPLQFIGAGRQMREQALPLLFRVRSGAAALAAGMPVRVVAATASRVRGAAVPAAAVQRGAGGEATLWVKLGPEHFAQRQVEVRPLDGERVAVTAGLQEGERVVIVGASLLGQVR